MVTLFLCTHGGLQKPLLYLSLYLKSHRSDYYRLLQEVRTDGAWEAWLDFFLVGVADTANQAFEAATRIVQLFKQDRAVISEQRKHASTGLRIHDQLQQNPYVTVASLALGTGLSKPTINAALEWLVWSKIVHEITGRQRGRVFAYQAYLDILNEGTTPPVN
jgi:Fic family protein